MGECWICLNFLQSGGALGLKKFPKFRERERDAILKAALALTVSSQSEFLVTLTQSQDQLFFLLLLEEEAKVFGFRQT